MLPWSCRTESYSLASSHSRTSASIRVTLPGPRRSTDDVVHATSAPTSSAFRTSAPVCTPEVAASDVPGSWDRRMPSQRRGRRRSSLSESVRAGCTVRDPRSISGA